jgi:hypothetical protein
MRKSMRTAMAGLLAIGLAAGLAVTVTTGASAYQPTTQTMYAAANPSSCNKSPCILYPKSAQLPGGRLVAAFEDSEGAVVGQTLPIFKSDDNGDTWQKLTNLPAPASLSSASQYAPYTSNWTNPYFYVLTGALGSYAAGTLMLADVVSGNGTDGTGNTRQNIAIALYASTDQGATWSVVGLIATGPNEAQDPVWEPYLMQYQGNLVAYYSDENDYLSYNTTTGVPTIDPNNTTATDSGGQILVHRTWSGTGGWSSPVVDVSGDTSVMGGGKTEIGAGRPGMTNIVPTTDGKWMLTYEFWGGGNNVRYKIASSPLQFFTVGGTDGTNISSLPVSSGSGAPAQGGSPVLSVGTGGEVVYNAAGSGDVWVNTTGSSTGTWKEYHTSIASGYSRDLQYVSATGRFEIIQAPWGNGPVSFAQLDLGHSVGTYYALVNRSTGQVLTPQSGKTQDAAFTGNVADIVTAARSDSSDGQWWHFVTRGTSTALLNKSGGRALGLWQGSATSGTGLTQWVDDGGTDKAWNMVASTNGYYKLQSSGNTSLYATAGSSGSSVTLQTATTTGTQDWQVVPDLTTAANAYFEIVNVGSGKVLGILGGSTANGASAVQWTASGALDQQWKITIGTNGKETLTDRNSSKVLGINGASTASGAQAVQWTGTGSADQQWTLVQTGPYFSLQDVNSGLYLAIQGASTANGANAIQATADGLADQQWQLVQVAGS